MKKIDIVDIKQKIKNKEFLFYVKDGCIYLKDIKSNEIIIVGEYIEHMEIT